jgi:sugar-phosphatase
LPKPEVFITAERVKRGKPEPDAFLLGAELLGLARRVRGGGRCGGRRAGRAERRKPRYRGQRSGGSPRLDEADFVLDSLTALAVSKAPDGVVTVSLKM